MDAQIDSKKLEDARLMRRATTAALCVATGLAISKLFALLLTGSVAMMGSFIDSSLDILATGFNFIAIRQALRPPDREHRFGHGKIEPLAGLARGAFIGGSAVYLFLQSITRLFNPEPVNHSLIGAGVTVVALVVTAGLVLFQRMVKKRTGSLVIGADELHYRSDLVLNCGVLLALFLSSRLHYEFADALIGSLIAIYVAWGAYHIARKSYDQLMDHEFDEAERAQIKALVHAHPEVVAMHDLRTRRSGRDAFIQFHLELGPSISLLDAHRIADDVERQVQGAFPQAEVMIHEDPAGVEAPHTPISRAN